MLLLLLLLLLMFLLPFMYEYIRMYAYALMAAAISSYFSHSEYIFPLLNFIPPDVAVVVVVLLLFVKAFIEHLHLYCYLASTTVL